MDARIIIFNMWDTHGIFDSNEPTPFWDSQARKNERKIFKKW